MDKMDNKEITNEIKLKVLGQYLGKRMRCKYPFRPNKNSQNEKGELIFTGCILADFEEKIFDISLFQLILKPLSQITDEDAIEAGAAYFKNFDKSKAKVSRSMLSEHCFLEYHSALVLLNGGNTMPIVIYQLLQSKGYDLCNYYLNGKTLFESGLCIYESEIK